MSVAVRRASREVIGPWYYLDPRNPSGRGVTFDTLIKMIEKGRIKADSIVRGPNTHQDWLFAAEAPRLAKYLGMCPHCFGEAKPEDTYCTRCQLNMNTRPAEPRPGIPEALVKTPVHKEAYEVEKQLADETTASDNELEGQALDVRAAAPAAPAAPARAAEPVPMARSVGRTDSAATMAAAMAAVTPPLAGAQAAMAGAVTAAGERSSHTIRRRARPKLWIVLAMTWATLAVLFLILLALVPGLRNQFPGFNSPATPGGDVTQGPGTSKQVDEWLDQRLKDVEKARTLRDSPRLVTLYKEIYDHTRDPAWMAQLEVARQQVTKDAEEKTATLRKRLDAAEAAAGKHDYDTALAVLGNIGKDDREFLLARGLPVESMERTFRADKQTFLQQKQLEDQLRADLERVNRLKAVKKYDEAVKELMRIKQSGQYSVDLLQAVAPKLDEEIMSLDALATAGKVKLDPANPPKSDLPVEQAKAAVAELMGQAIQFEKSDKWPESLAKLEEIQKRFDKKVWPEGLEERIKMVKNKIEALKFFGLDPPPAPKTEKPPEKTPEKPPL
jgi:hypothetical protein